MGKEQEKLTEIRQLEQDVKELNRRMAKVEEKLRDIQEYMKGWVISLENGKP